MTVGFLLAISTAQISQMEMTGTVHSLGGGRWQTLYAKQKWAVMHKTTITGAVDDSKPPCQSLRR